MADTTHKLIGQNYTPPDLVAKVTGQAKYAEDFRAEGMLFTKLLLSPMPHARVRNIDATAALAMPGVHAILTEEDCPRPEGPMFLGEGVTSTPSNVPIALPLTNEPVHQGEPILAVAADSEQLAADAIERIVVDPIQALRPGSPDPREQGNAWVGNQVESLKLTEDEWREVEAGRLPFREAPDMWEVGDVEAGFAAADLVIDETLVSSSTSHDCMEPRSAMAYWQNGKLYLHLSTQSISFTVGGMAQQVGIDPSNLVLIGEYCRRRLWQQGGRRTVGGDPCAVGAENRPARHDAREPSRGAAALDGPSRTAPACQDRLPPGWPDYRDGLVHRAGQRSACEARGRADVRGVRDGQLHAAQLPCASDRGAEQYAPAHRPARTRRGSADPAAGAADQAGGS